MAELKDFGTVKTWYEAYKTVQEAEDKKPEDEKEDEKKKKSPVEVLPKDGGDEEQEEKKEEKPDQSGEVEKLKAEIEKLKGELQAKDLEVKKKDAETTVEPNPDTGEIPLRVGIAQSILDKKKKAEKKNGKDVKEATVVEDKRKDKLMKMKAVVDMLDGTHGRQVISNSDYDKLVKLGKKVNKFENPRGASPAEKKAYRDLTMKYANKLGSKKKEFVGYVNDVLEQKLNEVNTKDGTMTSSQLDRLKQSYSTVGNTIDPEKAMALSKMLNRFGEGELRQLVRKDIKFVSTLAVNKLIMKHNYKAKDIHDIRRKK